MKVRIVLVRPRNPLNIGAAARAMANFGFDDMVVVNPYAPVWRETTSAVGAEALVLKARAVATLKEAISDCGLVLGTTAVRKRRLERTVVRLPELAPFLEERGAMGSGRIALLFGSEKTGLTKEHLEHCNAYVTIPTDAAQPSMNLAQAVAVCCYELSRKVQSGPRRAPKPATAGEREQLIKHALELFKSAGYLGLVSDAHRAKMIRQSLLQWNIRPADVRLLHGIMRYMLEKLNKERVGK